MNEKNKKELSPHSPYHPALPRVPDTPSKHRFGAIIPLALLIIVVLIIIGTLTPLNTILVQFIRGATPIPEPTIIPGDDLFYIRIAPEWGTIYIDGHALTHIPSFPPDPALRLSRGTHTISWHADPFLPESCIVSVPSLEQNSCPYESTLSSQSPAASQNAHLIEFDASLQNLPENLQNSLITATQDALNALQSSTTVRPGELYALLPSPQLAAATATMAIQPLQAVLRFRLDTDPHSNRTLGSSGPNCLQFCTSAYNQPISNQGQHIWVAEAPYYPYWDYSSANGKVVAQGQPDSIITDGTTTDYGAFFDIQWINKAWRVTVDSSVVNNPTLDYTSHDSMCQSIHDQTHLILAGCAILQSNHPACASLRDLVSVDLQYSSTSSSAEANLNWSYVVGQNAADGCLGIILPKQQNTSPASASRQQAAYCLYRFGVLLAANPLAHRYWPDLPSADVYEQQIAQQIASVIGL